VILFLQEFFDGGSATSRVVLVRFVFLLPDGFGLEFSDPFLGSSSVDGGSPWRQHVVDPGVADDGFSPVRSTFYDTFLLLVAFSKFEDASSVQGSASCYLLLRLRLTGTVRFKSAFQGVDCNFLLFWGLSCKEVNVMLPYIK
jgi:hypothetical protein